MICWIDRTGMMKSFWSFMLSIRHCQYLEKYFIIGLHFTIPSAQSVLLGSSKLDVGSEIVHLPTPWLTDRVEGHQIGLPSLARAMKSCHYYKNL